jgi:hypothetical protein
MLLWLALALVAVVRADDVRVSWGFDVSRASITVYQGDRVTWVLDQGPSNHTLTSAALSTALGKPFGGSFTANASYSLLVQLPPGSYAYFCANHPTIISAVLTVLESINATYAQPGLHVTVHDSLVMFAHRCVARGAERQLL